MSDVRDAVLRALRLSIEGEEADYERAADRILSELGHSTSAVTIKRVLGPCRMRQGAHFWPLNGAEQARILGFAYDLAGGLYTCQCYYCQRRLP